VAQESSLETAAPGVILYGAYASLKSAGADPLFLYMTGGGAALCGALTFWRVAGEIKSALDRRQLLKPSGLHGRVETLNANHPDTLGLHLDNGDGNGIPLGVISSEESGQSPAWKRKIKAVVGAWLAKPIREQAGPGWQMPTTYLGLLRFFRILSGSWKNSIVYYKGDGHLLIAAGTGGGKTSSLSKPTCVSLGKHHNRIVTSKGVDLAVSTYRFLTQVLGHDVVCIDPFRLLKSHGIKSDDYNPCDILVELAARQSPEIIDKAREIALVLIPEDLKASGENAIFRSIGRQFMSCALIHLAIEQEATGELCCNLAYLNKRLSGSTNDLMALFYDMALNDDFGGVVSRAGNRFIDMFKNVPKSAQSFATQAQDALEIFEPASMIGRSCEHSTFRASDIKNPNRNMTIHIVLPPEKSGLNDAFAGLCLNTLATICIEADSYHPPVTIIADEFESLSPSAGLPIIERVLKVGRSRGCRLMAYVQDLESLRARYGDLTNMFKTQSAIFMAMDVRSVDEAEEYSRRAGQRSVITDTASVDDKTGEISLSIKEEGVPLLRSDELTRMKKFRAIVMKEQYPPQLHDLLHYRCVDPWAFQIDDVPGSPPEGVFEITQKA